MIAQGQKVQEFENAFSAKFGFDDSVAVSSGTAGLHLALIALDIGPGDEVIIPSYVCTALLNAVQYVGAKPIVADIRSDTFNLDPVDAKKRITNKTKAIIVPHMFGLPADLKPLIEIGIPIIEDCAQSVGANYQYQPVGSLGNLSVFSFYATKVMTTGEGGMVAGCDSGLIEKIKDLRDYDNRSAYKTRYNYKMTDIQAAMGIVQLNRLMDFVAKRKQLAECYQEVFKSVTKQSGVRLPIESSDHIYFRFVMEVKCNIDDLIKKMQHSGINCARPVFRPIHKYLKLKNHPESDAAWKTALSIPIYPDMTIAQTQKIAKTLMDRLG